MILSNTSMHIEIITGGEELREDTPTVKKSTDIEQTENRAVSTSESEEVAKDIPQTKKKRNLFTKASAAIAMEDKMSFQQRKIFNVLLAYSYDEMHEKETHVMPAFIVRKSLKKTISGYTTASKLFDDMVEIPMRWNLLKKDRRLKAVKSPIFSRLEFNKETMEITWSFPSAVRNILKPNGKAPVGGKLSLRRQSFLKSKYALTLYELGTDYYDSKKGYGETPPIPLKILEKIFGSKYKEWKEIKKRVLATAIKYMNRVKEIPFTADFKKVSDPETKATTAIQFILKARIKEQQLHEKQTNAEEKLG